MLASYGQRESFKKIIPKVLFFLCHIFSKSFCIRNKIFVVWDHSCSFPSCKILYATLSFSK